MCNGMTIAQDLARKAHNIEEFGFWITTVEADPPWAYTAGLAAVRHPELVVAGIDGEVGATVLSRLADRVLGGERFVPGGICRDKDVLFGFRRVHPAQLKHGLCACWDRYTEFFEPDWAPLSALQVVLPSAWFCSDCRRHQPRLDRGTLHPWTTRKLRSEP